MTTAVAIAAPVAELEVCYFCDRPSRFCTLHDRYWCGCAPCTVCADPDSEGRRAIMESATALANLAARYAEAGQPRGTLADLLARLRRLAEDITDALTAEGRP